MGSKYHLRRSKSTRSVRTNHADSRAAVPFDPETAKLHARAAASRAMLRSSDRSSLNLSEGSYNRLGGPSNVAIPQRRHRVPKPSCTSDNIHSEDGPLSGPPNATPTEAQHIDQSWPAALPSIDEFGGLENRISSHPSSYRRLRKTRSMFSARQRSPPAFHRLPASEPFTPSVFDTKPPSDTPKSYRSLKRSMSFLKRDNKPTLTLRHAKSHDVVIQLANCQLQQSYTEHENILQLPPLPVAKSKREHKPFRKTFRNSSPSDKDTPEASPSAEYVTDILSHGKTRSFSSSLKKGLKRVFGLSKPLSGQPPIIIPSLNSKQDWSPTTNDQTENDRPVESHTYERPGDKGSSRGFEGPSSLRSMQSYESLATTHSRVTSWADSTAANTITTPKAGSQRLSIIDEQPFQSQYESIHSGLSPHRPYNSIDTHRLFSALMKRIGKGNAQEPDGDVSTGQVKKSRAIPTSASLHLHSSKTIRQVPSHESVRSPRSFTTAIVEPVTPQTKSQDSNKDPHIASYPRITKRVSLRSYSPEDDSESVVIRRPESESDSPSIYSRATDEPSPKPRASANSPDIGEELGVATIFAPQRTTYSSPNRRHSSSGTDWENWMDTQMERFENPIPTQYHYREDAQIQDYEDSMTFDSSIPIQRARQTNKYAELSDTTCKQLTRKVSTSSNFSRPFSRSSSARTIAIGSQSHTNSTLLPISQASGIRRVSNCPAGQDSSIDESHTRDGVFDMSPMQSRTRNNLRILESPTPRRITSEISSNMDRGAQEYFSTTLSRNSLGGKSAQLRSARIQRDRRRTTDENSRIEPTQYSYPRDLQSPISSKRMVEMFLNSRRRQMGTDVVDDSSSEKAFL